MCFISIFSIFMDLTDNSKDLSLALQEYPIFLTCLYIFCWGNSGGVYSVSSLLSNGWFDEDLIQALFIIDFAASVLLNEIELVNRFAKDMLFGTWSDLNGNYHNPNFKRFPRFVGVSSLPNFPFQVVWSNSIELIRSAFSIEDVEISIFRSRAWSLCFSSKFVLRC